ncbi:MAG: LysR family transcriptional regulator [Candidatus Merdisoma sp.]|jgi:hypothetical protein
MEIKQLEFFVAACDRGSFDKAAECLYTTQPMWAGQGFARISDGRFWSCRFLPC